MPRDYRDGVIESLAYDLALANEQLVEALRDRHAYQLLAKTAIEQNATLTAENARLRQCVRRNLEDVYGARVLEDGVQIGAAA